MSVLALSPLMRLALLFAAVNWTCDQCRRVNSDSVTTCYNCGA